MRSGINFSADYQAYLAAQKQPQAEAKSTEDVENFEMVSNTVSVDFSSAGPCNGRKP